MSIYPYQFSEDNFSSQFIKCLPVEPLPPPVEARVLQRLLVALRELVDVKAPDHPSILIIDDQDLFRQSLAHTLEDAGYKVFCAANGQDALQLCTTQVIHVALLDSHLPDMDGYDLCMELSNERHVPVIIMSELRQATEILEGFAAGASAYVCKPFPLRELSAQIRQTWAAVIRQKNQHQPMAR
jgi:CheY-like chemotaxis protein